VKIALGYPDADDELLIMREQRHGHPLGDLVAAVSTADIRALQAAVEDVYVAELLERWIVALVRATREVEAVEIGASVRGSLALDRTARAWALLQGRDYVTADDIERLFLPVIGHRLLLTPSFLAETRNLTSDEALALIRATCFELAPPPEPDWDGARPALEQRARE
jgi:MoxR-like ATPase